MSELDTQSVDTIEASMSDGAQLRLRRMGNPNGTRLIVSHGNGFAVDGYRVFWEPLLQGYELILFDMRNHGCNGPTGADGHHYRQLADDIKTVGRAVNEALGERTTVGVFHSMSARAAMKLALEHGPVWDALVLFDPPNVPPPTHPVYESMHGFELRLIDYALNRQSHFNTPEELIALYRESRGSSRWLPQACEDMARAVLHRDPDQADGWTLVCTRELEASIYLAALTLNLWPTARELGVPVKLIGADPTLRGNTPTARANETLAQEGGYLYEAIADCGHLLQIERPDACRTALLSFLQEQGVD